MTQLSLAGHRETPVWPISMSYLFARILKTLESSVGASHFLRVKPTRSIAASARLCSLPMVALFVGGFLPLVPQTAYAAKPVISSLPTANGTVGVAFTYQIAASNSPTSYSATGLPAGLSVSTSTGKITGTPTAAAVSNVTWSWEKTSSKGGPRS